MSYFKRFPIISNYELNGRQFDMMDITRRTGFSKEAKESSELYIEHSIKDGETPIILADRLYDNSDLFWVIMVFNDIFDINLDWPMDTNTLIAYTERVYYNLNDIHHYESIASGNRVDSDWPSYDLKSVTNYEYETELNDAKRLIKVPIPEVINNLVKDHNRLISQ